MSSASDFATAAQAVVASLNAAIVDPADAVRLLSSLAGFVANTPTTASAIGQAMATMQAATGDMFRRAAVTALARASAAYQPSSADDAAAVRTVVCAAIDHEIDVAGDQGEDATFNALRVLRAAVSQDLAKRGTALAEIATITTLQAIPAPVLAQRIYRDASRADGLVTQANPIHPAFMPTSFRALSK